MGARSRTIALTACLLLYGLGCKHLAAQQIVEDIGHYTQIGLPIAAAGIAMIKKDKDGLIQLAQSVAVETVIVYSMKQLIDRERPNGGRFAFPSGHTALSFTSSTFLYKRYGWQYGVPASIAASFVAFSRYGTDEPVHYFSDVVAGAAIGIATSLFLTKKYRGDLPVDISGGWGGGSFVVQGTVRF